MIQEREAHLDAPPKKKLRKFPQLSFGKMKEAKWATPLHKREAKEPMSKKGQGSSSNNNVVLGEEIITVHQTQRKPDLRRIRFRAWSPPSKWT